MTKGELAKRLLDNLDSDLVYDTAVPQGWLDHVTDTIASKMHWVDRGDIYSKILSSTVWLYREGNICGEPFPMLPEAMELLDTYNYLDQANEQ